MRARLDTCIAVNSFPGCNANMQCRNHPTVKFRNAWSLCVSVFVYSRYAIRHVSMPRRERAQTHLIWLIPFCGVASSSCTLNVVHMSGEFICTTQIARGNKAEHFFYVSLWFWQTPKKQQRHTERKCENIVFAYSFVHCGMFVCVYP